jgi:hypothetical protein
MTDAFSSRLRALHPALYVLVMLVATFVVLAPFAGMVSLFPALEPHGGPESMRSFGIVGKLIFGSVIVPLVETSLFQLLPIRLLRGRFHLNWWVVISTSAALFAATHYYSWGYVLFAFFIGLVLAYCLALRDTPGQHGFMLTCCVHALRNGIASFML